MAQAGVIGCTCNYIHSKNSLTKLNYFQYIYYTITTKLRVLSTIVNHLTHVIAHIEVTEVKRQVTLQTYL